MNMLPITCSLSPNTETSDVWKALMIFFQPWRWKNGEEVRLIEEWFRARYPSYVSLSVNSGRSALYLILQAFGIGKGDEVIVQSFTCIAVPNAVLWTGATPVYIDIDTRLNIDPAKLKKLLHPQTKAIIIQNTFGIPSQIEKIQKIAKEHGVIVIEDCAHSLGGRYESGKSIGSQGDASFFSFGRDKVVSSVFGGVGSINMRHKKAAEKFQELHAALSFPGTHFIFQQIFHPIAFSFLLPLYRLGIGKVLLTLLQNLTLLSFPVYREEKMGIRPDLFPKRYPNALAYLLTSQLKKLEKFSSQRLAVSEYYRSSLDMSSDPIDIPSGSILLRFPVFIKNRDMVVSLAKKHGILLGTWYSNILDPKGADFKKLQYEKGSCPNAEKASAFILNLPTRISLEDAKKVVECFVS